MDTLITAVAIALLCLAAWLLYKRFCARFKSQPDEEEEYEEEELVQEAVADPTPQEDPEPKKEA